MDSSKAIKLFDNQKIRASWDEEQGEWYFSIVDVVGVLTESANPRRYWSDLKIKLKNEGSELYDIFVQLKLQSEDGKYYLTDVANERQLFRLIQSIPSPKAEPFKQWMAKVAKERLDEMQDPELSIDLAIKNYRRLGYSENWINQRIKSIEVRKALTDEWDKSGVRQGKEYADLTDMMSEVWSGMSTREYKKFKGLKKENLRDNMTNVELILNMLAEASATELSQKSQPKNFDESAKIATSGAGVAKDARKSLELRGGEVISRKNARHLGTRKLKELT